MAHVSAADNRMVHGGVERWVVQSAIRCRKRDKPLMAWARPIDARAAMFRRAALWRSLNRRRIETLFASGAKIDLCRMDKLTDCISHIVILGGVA